MLTKAIWDTDRYLKLDFGVPFLCREILYSIVDTNGYHSSKAKGGDESHAA